VTDVVGCVGGGLEGYYWCGVGCSVEGHDIWEGWAWDCCGCSRENTVGIEIDGGGTGCEACEGDATDWGIGGKTNSEGLVEE